MNNELRTMNYGKDDMRRKSNTRCSLFMVHSSTRGFTLIELLVVISIIGILVGFVFTRYQAAEQQARDAQRKSDLNQYRIALENFASANNSLYPVANGVISTLCGYSSFQATYLSGGCLNDPRVSTNGDYFYYASADGTQYAVWGKLESGGYFEVCSNGRVGKMENEPEATNGSCEIP